MPILGRNNFGTNIYHFTPPTFKTKRQCKKILRRICGRKYPLSLDVIMSNIDRGTFHRCSAILLLDKRGISKAESLECMSSNYDSLEHDQWLSQTREEHGVTVEKQAWGIMAERYKHDWKMKEPKK